MAGRLPNRHRRRGGSIVYWNEPDGHQWEMLDGELCTANVVNFSCLETVRANASAPRGIRPHQEPEDCRWTCMY